MADAPLGWLNYHHLFYFWTVAREGSIAAASRRLRLSQPTVSEQIAALEAAVGERLFRRTSRGIALTEMGATVHRFADAIFTLGRELEDTVRGRPTGRPMRFAVGVADEIPKLLTHRLLGPALSLEQQVRLECSEDKVERLLSELSLHALDLVIADTPVSPGSAAPLYGHLLGECGVSIVGSRKLAAQHQRGFPASLDGAPFLMPLAGTALRRSLDAWFVTHGVEPRVVAELQDSALLQVFAQEGVGLFATPAAVLADLRRHHGLVVLGEVESLRQRYYAISGERKLNHPAVLAIRAAARETIFPARRRRSTKGS